MDAPIGIFDSGIGGLSILREIRSQLPAENAIYLADQAWAPYGDRTLEEVRSRAVTISGSLIGRGAKAVVVACNSASAAALHHLRAVFPETPFVGMEPALKPAAQASSNGVIGVLATPTTFEGELYASVLDRHASAVAVHEVKGGRLATLVEEGRLDEARADLVELLTPMVEAGIDRLVLGCTHYPFLSEQIRSIVGPGVQLVDPSSAVARQLDRVLEGNGLLSAAVGGVTSYLTTGDPQRLQQQVTRLIGDEITAERVAL